jgi:hypothetical protein
MRLTCTPAPERVEPRFGKEGLADGKDFDGLLRRGSRRRVPAVHSPLITPGEIGRVSSTVDRFNPMGNERLTAGVGIVLLVLTLVELATIPLGVHSFMSLHVFVGLVLIPAVLLKLASTGWRFVRYYSGASAYVMRGPPRLGMRLLAPLLIAATIVLFASGVAMGILHGHALAVARQLHGPSSVVWIVLVVLHALVYLRRALADSTRDVAPSSRGLARGAGARAYLLSVVLVSGVVTGIATVPAQHHWVDLRHDHHHEHDRAPIAAARRRFSKT